MTAAVQTNSPPAGVFSTSTRAMDPALTEAGPVSILPHFPPCFRHLPRSRYARLRDQVAGLERNLELACNAAGWPMPEQDGGYPADVRVPRQRAESGLSLIRGGAA
jgi:hypothetical protein